MSGDADPIMRLEGVRFAYHDRCYVVDEVTTAVRPGELHALLGPNASGKSTLIRLMLGQLRPAAGRITLGDRPVHRLPARRRAGAIAYVPQRSTVAFSFTVREVVEMGRHALPRDDEAVGEAIELCELTPLADRPYAELSVGQQQRVLVARAIAQAAGAGRLILADEPTSAMDLSHLHRSLHELRQLAGAGLGVVAALQDLNLAARYADHIWLLDQGRLVADGRWDQVLTPAVLEPVYGVSIREATGAGPAEDGEAARPLFDVRLPAQAARG